MLQQMIAGNFDGHNKKGTNSSKHLRVEKGRDLELEIDERIEIAP